MKEFVAACVQISIKPNDVQANISKGIAWLKKAVAEYAAELVVFPETVTTGYETGLSAEELWDLVYEAPGRITGEIQMAARELGVYVVWPSYRRGGERGEVYNSAILIGPQGEITGIYDKTHPAPWERRDGRHFRRQLQQHRDQGQDLAVVSCGGGCTVLGPAGPVAGTVLIDGNSLPQAPDWVGSATARYGVPVGPDGEFFVYTDWTYRSDVSFFLYESAEFHGKSLVEGGLRVGYNWNYGQYEVALFGRNILDKVAAVGGIDFNNLTGFVNEPRIWGVEFKATF